MKVKLNIVKPRIVPYAVKGKTYEEAANYLASKPFAACYAANSQYTAKKDKSGNTVEIAVICKPSITMPNWPGAKKLKGEEKTCWDKMIVALKKHEQKHHTKYEADLKAFKKEFEAAGDFPFKETAQKMKAAFAKCQKTQDAYDSQTNNGISEGVDLPVLS